MKSKVVKGLSFLVLILLGIACNTKKEQTAAVVIDKEQIKKEIQAKEDEYAATYNAGETKSIGYYADDATTFAQNKPPLVGKKAILEYLSVGIDSLDRDNKISFATKEVFVSNDGNMVLEIGYYKVIDSAKNDTINTGNYMVLFEKRDGKYVCVRDMSASDMPRD
jgi:ketosteroid isomerase-like protein